MRLKGGVSEWPTPVRSKMFLVHAKKVTSLVHAKKVTSFRKTDSIWASLNTSLIPTYLLRQRESKQEVVERMGPGCPALGGTSDKH